MKEKRLLSRIYYWFIGHGETWCFTTVRVTSALFQPTTRRLTRSPRWNRVAVDLHGNPHIGAPRKRNVFQMDKVSAKPGTLPRVHLVE